MYIYIYILIYMDPAIECEVLAFWMPRGALLRKPDEHRCIVCPHAVPEVGRERSDEELASLKISICPDLSLPGAFGFLAMADHEVLGSELGEALVKGHEAHGDLALEGPDSHVVILIQDELVPLLLDSNLGLRVRYRWML